MTYLNTMVESSDYPRVFIYKRIFLITVLHCYILEHEGTSNSKLDYPVVNRSRIVATSSCFTI